LIPIPGFVPKQTLSTAGGIHVSNSETDPPTPSNRNFNPWSEWVGGSGNYETAIDYEAAFNASFPPLSVSLQGNLIMTNIATGQTFRIA